MRLELLRAGNLTEFLDFCARHRPHLDDSFLAQEEMVATLPSADHPTWLAREGDRVVAAASLILDDYHLRGRSGRFRILYSEIPGAAAYRRLLDAIRPAPGRIDHWFVFVRDGEAEHKKDLLAAGFHLERMSRILTREALPVEETALPDGIVVRSFVPGQDEAAYAAVRNAAFADLQGSTTPLTPEDVAQQVREAGSDLVCIFLLCRGEQVLGIVCGVRDAGEDDDGPRLEIGPLAILPGCQGRGFGTMLLRRALRFGAEQAGLPRAVLCVNAENEAAFGLYLREGFTFSRGFSCLRQDDGPRPL